MRMNHFIRNGQWRRRLFSTLLARVSDKRFMHEQCGKPLDRWRPGMPWTQEEHRGRFKTHTMSEYFDAIKAPNAKRRIKMVSYSESANVIILQLCNGDEQLL